MSTDRTRRLALSLVVATAALVVAGIPATIATPGRSLSSVWSSLAFVPAIAAFSAVGGLIALRQPGNMIGWLMAVIGLLFAVVLAASSVSEWALESGALPEGVAEWISVPAVAWVWGLGLIGIQLPLRLPDGRLPSSRWRWYSRVSIALIAISSVGMAVQPGRISDIPGTANPIGSESLRPIAGVVFLVILGFVGALAALVIRYRRAESHDRAQLRWIALGGAVFLAVYLVTLPLTSILGISEQSTGGVVITGISQVTFAALAVAIGYAVLRQRLYDIDVVVNRALVYGTLTVTLAAVYLGSVLALQLALSPSSDLAIAASTLAVAGLVRPARRRIQESVDRRFYRRKYDAAQTLRSFSAHLRDEVDLATLGGALQAVVAETMQPAHVSLWLRVPETRS